MSGGRSWKNKEKNLLTHVCLRHTCTCGTGAGSAGDPAGEQRGTSGHTCTCCTHVPAVPAQAVQAIPRESSVGREDTRVPAVHMYLRYRRRQCRQSRGKAPRDESYTKEHEKNSHRGNTVKKHSPRSCRSALQDKYPREGTAGR